MSDKSRDAEHEDVVPGDSDAAGSAAESDNDTLSIFDIDDPEALEEAEEAVVEDADAKAVVPPSDSADDDATIAQLEENFTDEEKAAAAAAPIGRKTAKAPVRKKDGRTRKRSEAVQEHDDPYKAHNPIQFAGQSAAELKKVVWPTWPETVKMFAAVLVFVLIMILIVGILDFAFTWGLLKMLGSKS